MDRAFKQAFGRGALTAIDLEEGKYSDAELQADVDMWNAAWDMAKKGWLS